MPQNVRRTGLALLMIFTLLFTAACAGANQPKGSSGSKPETSNLLSCGGGVPFPEEGLQSKAGVENEDSDIGLATKRAMENEEFDRKEGGFKLLSIRDDVAILGSGDPLDYFLELKRENGEWRTSGWGGCEPRRFREGFAEAEWELDPGFPAPTSVDSEIHVLAVDRQCASGKSPEGRLLPPQVETEDSVLVITFAARPLKGGQDCQGHQGVKRTVDLGQQLGSRGLADGGLYPPRVVLPPSQ